MKENFARTTRTIRSAVPARLSHPATPGNGLSPHNCLRLLQVAAILVVALNLSYVQSQASPQRQAAAPSKAQPKTIVKGTDYSAALNGYWGRLRQRISNNWLIPDGKNHVVLTATVQQDGTTADLSVTGNPSDPQAEQSCSDAFTKCQPLEALPQGLASAKLSVTFDYNYDPHGDGSSKIYGLIAPQASQNTQQKQTTPAANEGTK